MGSNKAAHRPGGTGHKESGIMTNSGTSDAVGTFMTKSGALVALHATSAGGVAATVFVSGKKAMWGLLEAVTSHAEHGTVMTFVGQKNMVALTPESRATVEVAITAAQAMSVAAGQKAQAWWAAYQKTPEGIHDADMARIAAIDDDGADRAERT